MAKKPPAKPRKKPAPKPVKPLFKIPPTESISPSLDEQVSEVGDVNDVVVPDIEYTYADESGKGCMDLSKRVRTLKRQRIFLGDKVYVEVRKMKVSRPGGGGSFEYEALVFTRKAVAEGKKDFTFNLPTKLVEPLKEALTFFTD